MLLYLEQRSMIVWNSDDESILSLVSIGCNNQPPQQPQV
jgi:hypothetical protein